MDSKQDNTNKMSQLNNDQLPDELLWENMEAGIFHKMEALASTPSPAKNKDHKLRILLGLLLLLLGIILSSLYYSSNQADSQITTELAQSHSYPAVTKLPAETDRAIKEARVPASTAPLNIDVQSEVSQAYSPQHDTKENTATVDSKKNPSQTEKQIAWPETPTSSEGKITNAVDFSQNSLHAKQETNDDAELTIVEKLSPISSPHSPVPAAVNPLASQYEIFPVVSQIIKKDTGATLTISPVEPANPIRKNRPTQLWFTGGASWWREGYSSTKPERAAFEQTIVSHQGQFSYVKPLKHNLILLTGLQYQKLESRLNWNTLIPNFEVTLEDTIVQIQRNAITGEVNEIRGDVTLEVTANRQVQHYNSFSVLQVPFGMGKTWEGSSLQAHLLVGGVANISFSDKGRTLYQTELIEYNSPSADFWTDNFKFGAILSGGLSYRITEKFGLISLFQYQHSLSNWSQEQGIVMRPRILNVSVGVKYSL